MSKYAILENKKVKVLEGENAVFEWAKFTEKRENKVVDSTTLEDGTRVSTVFLGLNHGWAPGEDLWFETMIFDGPHDGYMDRYTTWDEAVEGHKAAVAKALNEGKEDAK